MNLNGWIGLKSKARERHVFTLPAITNVIALNQESNFHSPPALARAISICNGSGERFTG
jgi:hypothetical protein